jgi:hypothetical protein
MMSVTDYLASNNLKIAINELERMWKAEVVALLNILTDNFLRGLRKNKPNSAMIVDIPAENLTGLLADTNQKLYCSGKCCRAGRTSGR